MTETLSISSCIRPNKSIPFSNTLPCSFPFEIGLTECLWMMAVSWKISSACTQIPHKENNTEWLLDFVYITSLLLSILFSPLVLEVTEEKLFCHCFQVPQTWQVEPLCMPNTYQRSWLLEISWELLEWAASMHAWKSGFSKQWYQDYEIQITTKWAFYFIFKTFFQCQQRGATKIVRSNAYMTNRLAMAFALLQEVLMLRHLLLISGSRNQEAYLEM